MDAGALQVPPCLHTCATAHFAPHPHQPQACNGYPESGVCDASTWRLLLGQDAQPALISQLHSGQSDDEDLAQQVRVAWNALGYGIERKCTSSALSPACLPAISQSHGPPLLTVHLLPRPTRLPQSGDRVWLIGEQRWEDRSRVKRG